MCCIQPSLKLLMYEFEANSLKQKCSRRGGGGGSNDNQMKAYSVYCLDIYIYILPPKQLYV